MYKRPIQLGRLVLPASSTMLESQAEQQFDTPNQFRSGSRVYDSTINYTSKEVSLNGTFLHSDAVLDRSFIPKREGKDLDEQGFINALHQMKQQKVDLLAIGSDNRIYRLKVRVGIPLFPDRARNGLDFQVTLTGYESFWEDVTDFLFETYNYHYIDGQTVWKYSNDLKYESNNIPKFELVVITPPASFLGMQYGYQDSVLIWDSFLANESESFTLDDGLPSDGFTLDDGGAGDGFTLAGGNSGVSSPEPADFEISTTDNLEKGTNSFIFNTTSTENTYTIQFDKSFNIFQFGDGSPFLEGLDSIDLNIWCDNPDNLVRMTVRIISSPNRYLQFDLVGCFIQNAWKIASITNYTVKNFDGVVRMIKIISQNNGSPAKVKINQIRSVKNIGVNMDHTTGNVFVSNETGDIDVYALGVFDKDATTKQLSFGDRVFTLDSDEKYILIGDNKIVAGSSLSSLTVKAKMPTSIKRDLSISVNSNQPHNLYYKKINKYI